VQPNIIFILADDMGYGDFSRFNKGLSQTPILDNMIDESICFTQNYSASPVCNPARASLLTGRYPNRTGAIELREWYGLDRMALREVTIADILKNAGYATSLIGKWHLGSYDMAYHPMNRGFDETVCFRNGMHDYYAWRLEYNERLVRSDGTYLTDLFTNEAIDFIKRNKKKPFFLHLTYNAPHTPLQVPDEDSAPFISSGKFNWGVSMLYGMIRNMDRNIGRIFDTLKELSIDENTIVIFTSDNGPAFGGEGDLRLDRFNCNFNGSKFNVYEGGIRVPLVMRWPDRIKPGTTFTELAHFTDWLPTLCSAADAPAPKDLKLDGHNILPLIMGDKGEVDTKRFWWWNWDMPIDTSNAAVRDGDWKLIKPSIGKLGGSPADMNRPWEQLVSMYAPEYYIANGFFEKPQADVDLSNPPKVELYNILEDPLEENDLSGKFPDKVKKLTGELEDWIEDVEADRLSIDFNDGKIKNNNH